MFVQKRADHWLLIEWSKDGGRLKPVLLGQFETQQLALDAMSITQELRARQRLELPNVPLAQRGFGVKDCVC